MREHSRHLRSGRHAGRQSGERAISADAVAPLNTQITTLTAEKAQLEADLEQAENERDALLNRPLDVVLSSSKSKGKVVVMVTGPFNASTSLKLQISEADRKKLKLPSRTIAAVTRGFGSKGAAIATLTPGSKACEGDREPRGRDEVHRPRHVRCPHGLREGLDQLISEAPGPARTSRSRRFHKEEEMKNMKHPGFIALIAALVLAFGATAAWAHVTVKSTSPGKGTTVKKTLKTVKVTFSGTIRSGTLKVYGAQGRQGVDRKRRTRPAQHQAAHGRPEERPQGRQVHGPVDAHRRRRPQEERLLHASS